MPAMIIFDLKNDIAGVPYISTLRARPPKTEPVPKWTMNFYYYLFSCAYWYSIKDLKEDSSPQEYAFIYVSILDLLIFLILSGIVNLIVEHNLLNGGVVLLVSLCIVGVNYLVLLRERRYLTITERFEELGSSECKRKRRTTLFLAYLITGLVAIFVSALQTSKLKDFLGLPTLINALPS